MKQRNVWPWVGASIVAGVLCWIVAAADEGSSLQQLLSSLGPRGTRGSGAQLAQADTPPPAPQPNLERLLSESPAPAAPDAPQAPQTPEVPAAPQGPAPTPEAVPAAPTAPAMPAAPETPVAPGAPQTPEVPAAPQAPAQTPEAAPAAPAGPASDLEKLMSEAARPAEATPAAPAQPAAVPAAAETAPAAPAKPALSPQELEEQERVRRQAEEREGLFALSAAQEAMRLGDYQKALDQFQVAIGKIPLRPQTEEAIQRARAGRNEAVLKLGASNYEAARAAVRNRNWDAATKAIAEARAKLGMLEKPTEDQAKEQKQWLTQLERLETTIREEAARPIPIRETQPVRVKASEKESFYDQGRQYFALEEYDLAERMFEQVLRLDPYNRDAMRYLKKIEERRTKTAELRREATRTDFVKDVMERWNPPLRAAVVTPPQPKKVEGESKARQLQEKMQRLIIPSIEFMQANIVDVINFLRDASEAADPEGVGVNIILKLDTGAPTGVMPEVPAPAPAWTADPFAAQPAAQPAVPAEQPLATPTAEAAAIPRITLNLRRVSLLDAIRYVTEIANLKYRIEETTVIITPRTAVEGTIVTRLYPVQPSIIQIVTTKAESTRQQTRAGGEFITMGGAEVQLEQQLDMKKFFGDMGVPFPPGTSISYNPAISQLIVRNTPENLEIFERILAALDVVPKQVEIEARFVEIAQQDLSELGFEWLLTDNWELANKKGTGPIEARERIQVNANMGAGGFTRGLRYFVESGDQLTPQARTTDNAGQMSGNILSLSSILTNPELTLILHALERKGGADLLSSPRVTTRSGVNAQIKVVEELIYPTEYEQQSVGDLGSGFATVISPITGQAISPYAYRPPLPSSFETREIGVILNVTPTVGPDGYTIDLTLVPEVAEFVRWIDYGPAGLYPLLQPVFASRNVTTSIVLWDGQTVVMGGLIRDQVARMDDRIPLLGHVPVLGHLFRSKGEYSRKQNLVIFVTARLVDPAGNLIKPTKTSLEEIAERAKVIGGTP